MAVTGYVSKRGAASSEQRSRPHSPSPGPLSLRNKVTARAGVRAGRSTTTAAAP